MPCLSVFIFLNGFQDLRSLNRAVCYTSRMSFLTYKQSCAVCKLLIWNNPWTGEFYSLPNAGLITSDLQVGNSRLWLGTNSEARLQTFLLRASLRSCEEVIWLTCCRALPLLYLPHAVVSSMTPACWFVELSPHSLINIVCLGQDCSFDKHSHYNHYESTAML